MYGRHFAFYHMYTKEEIEKEIKKQEAVLCAYDEINKNSKKVVISKKSIKEIKNRLSDLYWAANIDKFDMVNEIIEKYQDNYLEYGWIEVSIGKMKNKIYLYWNTSQYDGTSWKRICTNKIMKSLGFSDDDIQNIRNIIGKSNNKNSTVSTRFKVLKRDNYRCQICGRTAKEDGVKLEVDHKVPRAKGGKDTTKNLWTLCFDCNRGKRDKDL